MTTLTGLLFLFLVATRAENDSVNSMHNRPQARAGSAEVRIDTAEIEALPNTHRVREVARKFEHVVVSSEAVTFDQSHGYIYRYDVDTPIEDERGGLEMRRGKLIVLVNEDDRLILIVDSLFELP